MNTRGSKTEFLVDNGKIMLQCGDELFKMATKRKVYKLLFLFICSSTICLLYFCQRTDKSSFVLVLRNGSILTFSNLNNLLVPVGGVPRRPLSSQHIQKKSSNVPATLNDSVAQQENDTESVSKATTTVLVSKSPSPSGELVTTVRSAPGCSNDEQVMDMICLLRFSPEAEWEVPFHPANREHHVKFEHETLKVDVAARACHCNKQVRMGSKDGAVNSKTWVLQSGQIVQHLFVVDDRHSKQWVYSKYTLVITRENSIPEPESFVSSKAYNICELHQDCDMHIQEDNPCGLQRTGRREPWMLVQAKLASLPPCANGHHKGHWVLPCIDCSNRRSCFWQQAVWAAKECSYSLGGIEDHALQGKFSGKTFLFFGDSTIRGIMYYMIERINGSLQVWEMSHGTLLYTNVNGGSTAMCFMYYPQFWLPLDQRNNTLARMLEIFSPLRNTSDTVLIFGGVQWPNLNTLREVERTLKDFGLTGIKVVVKGYGSGFSVPAAGILFHSHEQQKTVAGRNQLLMDGALMRGYVALDTFWMTVSRFKQALYGKCACHFHQVISTTDNHYHVTGDINRVFSDILIQILTL